MNSHSGSSSFSPSGGLVPVGDCRDGPAGFALFALQVGESVFLDHLCVELPAIDAPNVVFDILSNQTQIHLRLVISYQDHLVGGAQVSHTTQLRLEEVENVLVVSADRQSLFVEVAPD